ncbi:hypothetical protein BSKO_06507 [Bryopsis sp. KO-2023]|nr:hypothetical protein BSKO_06507 [Bryopsis sp. KO-2023]
MSLVAENWEQKVEEVIALESIYGSDFSLLGLEGPDGDVSISDGCSLSAMEVSEENSIECQVMILVDTPGEGVNLVFDVDSSSGSRNEVAGGKVHHLPPLSLTLKLTPEYPSTKPPEFTLNGSWLSQAHQQSVETSLQHQWEEMGPGVPTCFTWIDWLKSSFLESVGVSDRLVISDVTQAQSEAGPSNEAVSSTSAQRGESVVMQILRYDAVREGQVFREGTWECPVCMLEKPGREFIRVPGCKHLFCMDCFSEFCRVNVQEGQVELTCPAFKCNNPLEQHVIRGALSEEDYERWEGLLLQRTLDKMRDVRYCPRCNFVCVEESGHFAQCEKCYFAFCTKCYDSWHPGGKCVAEGLDIPAPVVSSKNTAQGNAEAARMRKDLVNQNLSRIAIMKNSKACPGCEMRIERESGCNKMKCSYCYTIFCFRCGETIEGYNHFWNDNCKLFDESEIQRWEAQQANRANFDPAPFGHALVVEERRMIRDEMVELDRENNRRIRQILCPFCRQQNFKNGNNNHIRCWSCSLGFCYLCRKGLGKKMGSHFKQGTCKQHSDD